MNVSLVWTTPNGDDLIASMARVSNPANQDNKETAPRLIKYLIKNQHWSPFEVVNACVEINTTRDIGRQILRHRSFSFQEFSGRYASYSELRSYREPRLQDEKNRQHSIPLEDRAKADWWNKAVLEHVQNADDLYKDALALGIAKEVARAILPEGLTPTRMYMNGTLRSWIHYWDIRCDEATQKEHRIIAATTREVILDQYPQLYEALHG